MFYSLSIFKSAFVSLNGNNLRAVEANYHIKEWIETSLNFNVESAESRLSSQLYVPNAVEATLKQVSKDSKTFELYGRINLLNISKLLLPGISFSLRLNLENPDFFIQEDIAKTKTTSKLKIVDAKLYIRHVTPSSDIVLAHERLLSSGKNAIYEYKRGEVISSNVAAGTKNILIPNFYNGPKPSLIVFGMLPNKSFTGDRASNPFKFGHNNLTAFNFIINGASRPANPYTIQNDTTHSCYAHLFSRVYEALGYHKSDQSNLITKSNFIIDHFLIIEDLSTFNIALTDVLEPASNVSIGINATLSTSLTSTMTCVLYMLIPSRFEVSANRAVTVIL